MRRVLTLLTTVVALLGVVAPTASADPTCPPVGRAYVSIDNPQPGGSFGHGQAFFARGGGKDFGQQVSREAQTEPPCP